MDFCLLIPYYNAWNDLIRSVNSIHYHSKKFSILIVDDGSDNPLDKQALSKHISPEIHFDILRLEVNQGIVKALNAGLRFLMRKKSVQYIARLDCGDICDQHRFFRQVNFLNNNPNIDLLGSWCFFKDCKTSRSYLYRTPTDHNKIEREMHFRNVFIHPTVMWRRSVMELYPENYPHAEDYALFYRLMKKVKCAVLPTALVTCKVNPHGISLMNRKQQLESRIAVVKAMGNSKLFIALGTVKIKLLGLLPYPLIFQLKKMLSVPKLLSHGI
jgi:glycosyltransferase involved in cell wall biosynthesis